MTEEAPRIRTLANFGGERVESAAGRRDSLQGEQPGLVLKEFGRTPFAEDVKDDRQGAAALSSAVIVAGLPGPPQSPLIGLS